MEFIDGNEFIDNIDDLNNSFSSINLSYSDLNNTLVLVDDGVIGLITYEKFGNLGLVKYFVIKKKVENEIKNFFEFFVNKVKLSIDSLFIFSNNEDFDTISTLGFEKTNYSNIYIGEVNYLKTDYKNKHLYILDFIKYS